MRYFAPTAFRLGDSFRVVTISSGLLATVGEGFELSELGQIRADDINNLADLIGETLVAQFVVPM